MLVKPAVAVRAAQATSGRSRRWLWSQQWRDVLLAHWRMPASRVQPHIPLELELDTWQDQAWVTAVAFRLEEVRLWGLPTWGPCSNLVELNLRTYVRWRGEPAIYFLSIHAGAWVAVALASRLTPLPYVLARIGYNTAGETAQFQCHGRSGIGKRPLFDATLRPTLDWHEAAADSLDAWLLERYCAYVRDRWGKLFRMRVEHPPWRVGGAALQTAAQGLGEPWGFDLARQPDLWHFSKGLPALVWPFEEARRKA